MGSIGWVLLCVQQLFYFCHNKIMTKKNMNYKVLLSYGCHNLQTDWTQLELVVT